MKLASTADVDPRRVEQGVTQQLILLPLRSWLVILPATQIVAALLYRGLAPLWMYAVSLLLLVAAAAGQWLLQVAHRRVSALFSDFGWRGLAAGSIVAGCLAQGLAGAMFATLPGDEQRLVLVVALCFIVTIVPSRWDGMQFWLATLALLGPIAGVFVVGDVRPVSPTLLAVLAGLLVLFNVAAYDARRQTRRLVAHKLVEADARREVEREEAEWVVEEAPETSRPPPPYSDPRFVAQAAERAKSTFLAKLSHELRTPMNGVIGTAELLEREPLTEHQKRLVHTVQLSATAVLGVIDDVLEREETDMSRRHLDESPFAIREVIDGTADALAAQAERKQLAVVTNVATGTPDLLVGDVMRVRQILLNLVDNAIKFTNAGKIYVEARTQAVRDKRIQLVLVVADTGIGMNSEQVGRLFLPNSRDEASTIDRPDGSGPGLVIVRRLARMMGGDVTVESAAGRGSIFTVSLGLGVADEPQERKVAPRAVVDPEHHPDTVLVVDDSELNLHVLCEQLRTLGAPFDTASDGLQGLAKWKAKPYAMVIADIHMPCMDGLEMTRQIRAEEALTGARRRTPIIALTADARRGVDAKAIAAGVDGYLTKPLMLRRLRETLDHWTVARATSLAVPPMPPTTGAIDRDALLEMVGGNMDVVESVLQRFARVGADLVVEIREAAHDCDRLKSLAHKLKGTARSVSAPRLGDLAEKLEHSRNAAGIDDLEDEWRRVAETLERWRPSARADAA